MSFFILILLLILMNLEKNESLKKHKIK